MNNGGTHSDCTLLLIDCKDVKEHVAIYMQIINGFDIDLLIQCVRKACRKLFVCRVLETPSLDE